MDMEKIKKTEECPCGSGKLYRSCCFNAKDKIDIKDELINKSGYLNNFIRSMYNDLDFECCLYPDITKCEGKIKHAHTLQNNGILSRLAVDGHVMITSCEVDKNGAIIKVISQGRNEATTFTGFCSKHDTEIFKDIETKEYNELPKQNFLFAYRAFAQEYYKKIKMIKNQQNLFKLRPTLTKEKEFVMNYRYRQLEMIDINEYKGIFDKSLIDENYDILNSIVLKLDEEYDFAVTTMFAPNMDIEGRKMNDPYSIQETRLNYCFITIFPSENESIILLSWLKEDDKFFEKLIKQIKDLDKEKLTIYINNLLPMYTENIILSPRLWNNMPSYSKRKFKEALGKEMIRTNEEINILDTMKSLYKYKDDFLEKPEYDLFKIYR